ncbi:MULTISPECIES: hypothetical protein [unclassified Saccharibacter]|uniref:hypothetical protein n=1 Tax=unclassified Saccharibacter TaxID=2648722 RepID=UPI001329C1FF|nr:MULTISPECIES: hypothetical protein [unclassified Saccharibacter]MXV35881.1 hypothetical protein [Saccharibacter sp. EH611]MXV58001.1 hypothetical protein [Saccharibacter sp. EH70]MXV66239.1 hypothetical protein [Saccharibacter sp. EH60]MXV66396.1 hypothetical protein [Saccharibacter sp. EH60]
MKRFYLVAAILALTACTPTRYKPLCPPLVHYTAQEERQAAEELRTHPELHELPAMMRDYGNERREMRGDCFPTQ